MLFGLKALLIVLITLPTVILVLSLAPFDRDGKFAYRFTRFWTWSILKIGGIRLRTQGLELLDPERPYVFMANHRSNIDVPVLVQSLPGFQLRWMAKKEVLRVPLFGLALLASRHIIVDRSDRSKAMASLRRAREMIKKGISVAFFPEGTRSTSDQLLPFKRGGFVLAVKTGAPIVPVTIKGSRSVLPRGDWRLRGGEIRVIVGEPIVVDQRRSGTLRSLVNQVRGIMESHSRQNGATTPDSSKCEPTAATEETLRQR
ncbi:MAG: 1-acyl-sn-glycerol-3-phosphate acyltransferase [Deltaproteobacteria bacterium]|nr:1-acyl-sn-glycerol-3-phosphate acyltransferase [Deltaproteobacteria bacterium]